MTSIAGRDELLYTSVIPWVSFTGFMHPMHFHPTDSIPRFAWGRYFEQGGRLLMPLAVQGHHALVDGLHIGRFYQHVEQDLAQPEQVLGAQPVPSA
jgi:chloramphenicol O-acetyltransferase type A